MLHVCLRFPLLRQLILSWTGARLEGGQYEKVNVNATDNRNSTCLHYAAAAGMKSCVEVREVCVAPHTHVWMGCCHLCVAFCSLRQTCVCGVLRVIKSAQNSPRIKSICFVFPCCHIQALPPPAFVYSI